MIKPKMSAKDIISIQMKALKNNNSNNNGIQKAYFFASPKNKNTTGPYSNFKKMITKNYSPLLNYSEGGFSGPSYTNRDNTKYKQRVYVVKDGTRYIYEFKLSRQFQDNDLDDNITPLYDPHSNIYLYNYWRTDSVTLISQQQAEHFLDKHGKNIYGKPLEICSTSPKTGYYRDGYCNTGEGDFGTHTVCSQVTDEFLKFTKSKGNDLSTPRGSFPGLKEGDHWCLCASRYKQAYDNGIKMPVKKQATHEKTLNFMNSNQLA